MFVLERLDFCCNGLLQFFLRNNQFVVGYTNGLGHALKCQLHIQTVFLGTKDDANGWFLTFLTLGAVEKGEVL